MLNPFRCRHKKIGWPLQVRLRNGQPSGVATCLCLRCAQRIVYDFAGMKTGEIVRGCEWPVRPFVIAREELPQPHGEPLVRAIRPGNLGELDNC